jgi:hypothetical protein
VNGKHIKRTETSNFAGTNSPLEIVDSTIPKYNIKES